MKNKFLWLVLCVLSTAPSSHAGIRVLFEFNEQGLSVHKVVDVSSSKRATSAIVNSQFGLATIFWLDEAGIEMSKSQVADPRVSYAPVTEGLEPHRLVVTQSGAWLVDGPDGARSATLFLPANPRAGLSELLWTVLIPDTQ